MRNPFHALTKNELRVLRDRVIKCASHYDPNDQPILDRLVQWLDEQNRR